MVTARFIDYQCEITQTEYIDGQADPAVFAQRLGFLMGHYDAKSRALTGSPVAKMVDRHYYQTLTNAVAAFHRLSTNDLGADPRDWVRKYMQ